jgi:gas vesicle protein
MSEMNQSNGSSGTGILLAAAVGAVLGAGVALLFAPCSGAETRDWLARRSREVKAGATSAMQRGKEAIRRSGSEISRGIAEASTLRG